MQATPDIVRAIEDADVESHNPPCTICTMMEYWWNEIPDYDAHAGDDDDPISQWCDDAYVQYERFRYTPGEVFIGFPESIAD